MIIATAGHVDHGKTTLLQAITGVNADRLPEEKKRGMTIDLGYAYWPQPDGRVPGFIDVPGHEKFLSNMLAGVGGIDHALLREHLLQLPEREHASQHSFRLAIDRAFTVKGAGLVVTGTALSGEVKVGDSLWLTGVNKPMRVRALHAQNQPTETAHAGQRIALNIAGDAEKEQINRGDWLLADVPPEPFTRVIVELQTHTPLTQWQPLHIHHAASHVTGRVSLLEDNLAELVFDTPLWLADNDRLVLRDISARNTLAGTLATYHEQHRDEPGPGRERLRRMALPMEDEALVLLLIEKMRESGNIHSHHGWLHLPDHKAGFSAEQQAIWQKAEPLFGDEPWWVRDLAKETGTDEQAMRLTLRQAAQQGIITAIVKDRYYRNDRIVEFANMIRDLDQECGSTCAADFRDRLGVGRKLAIQILEYFDRIGFTRRRGNDHLLRDALLFPEK